MKKINQKVLIENINKIAKYDLDNNKIFGSSYCVLQKNKIITKNHFGHVSKNSIRPINDDCIFRLASMTKPITAIATLILVDRGLLSLDDPIDKYLPEFKDIHVISYTDFDTKTDLGKAENQIKIENLLNHTSGIGSDPYKEQKLTGVDKQNLDNTIKFYINAGLDFEPSKKQQYSGSGAFDVLVKIIEKVSKKDYLTFLKEEIFEPCNMVDTTFIPTNEQWVRLVDMHNRVDGKSVVSDFKNGCIYIDYPCTHFLGGAGLVSTLNDYKNFASMLLNFGKADKKRIVKKKTFKKLITPNIPDSIMQGDEKWGLGVRVIVDNKYQSLLKGSFGWSGAYGSHFWIDPKNKIIAIFMKNSLVDGGSANESAVNFEKAVMMALDGKTIEL